MSFPTFEPDGEPISWSQLYEKRRRVEERFGKIWSLRVRRRYLDLVLENCQNGQVYLEIGAGQRRLSQHLFEHVPESVYKSMDVDARQTHDYYSLEDIEETFDRIFMFEVIEHLPMAEGLDMLCRLHQLLNDGGKLLMTTPNVWYPPAYLRDATHRTPYAYDELGALVTTAGFEVDTIVRLYNDPIHRKLGRRVFCYWVHRLVGIDFARQIMLVATKVGDRPADRK